MSEGRGMEVKPLATVAPAVHGTSDRGGGGGPDDVAKGSQGRQERTGCRMSMYPAVWTLGGQCGAVTPPSEGRQRKNGQPPAGQTLDFPLTPIGPVGMTRTP